MNQINALSKQLEGVRGINISGPSAISPDSSRLLLGLGSRQEILLGQTASSLSELVLENNVELAKLLSQIPERLAGILDSSLQPLFGFSWGERRILASSSPAFLEDLLAQHGLSNSPKGQLLPNSLSQTFNFIFGQINPTSELSSLNKLLSVNSTADVFAKQFTGSTKTPENPVLPFQSTSLGVQQKNALRQARQSPSTLKNRLMPYETRKKRTKEQKNKVPNFLHQLGRFLLKLTTKKSTTSGS